MLQSAFGPSCMNRASVFGWHKRFKEGRESVRDDERCGRSKEVRILELIGQIKNFIDKDRRVSIETISAQFDVSVGTVHTIIHEELKMRKICAKFVPRVLRDDQKERRCHDNREMVELINSDPAVLDTLVTCDESWIYCYDLETKRQSSQWKHAGSPRPKNARQSKSTHKLLMIPFFWQHWHDLHALGSHWTDSQQYYVKVLREFRKRFRRKRSTLLKSGQWHFQQDNAPVHNSILVTDYLTKMGIKRVRHPPYSPDLAPCDFWLFPKLKENLRGCRRYETIEEMKEAVTKVIDTLTLEDFHGAFQKLLERYNKCIAAGEDYLEGDQSFMCVLSIKVPIRKKSLETFWTLVYIYIYIYIYIRVNNIGVFCLHIFVSILSYWCYDI